MSTDELLKLRGPPAICVHALLSGVQILRSEWAVRHIADDILAITDGEAVLYAYRNGSIIGLRHRGQQSVALEWIVKLAGIDPSIIKTAEHVHPDEIEICGPLTIAAYRATWLPELDANGQRVRREQPNEQAAQTTMVVEP